MTWEAMAAYTLGDIGMLETAYQQALQPILIIIDPPANFLGKKDQHKDAEVRSLVMGLVAWLDTKQVASVFVTHVNKAMGKMVEALDRIMGSVAWGTTARIAVGFAPDPNTPRNACVPASRTTSARRRPRSSTRSSRPIAWLASSGAVNRTYRPTTR